MTRLAAGRIVLASEAHELRRWAEMNLLTVHGRVARALALVRSPGLHTKPLEGDPSLAELTQLPSIETLLRDDERSWILLRDYAEAPRGRHTVFLFEPGTTMPESVAKLRARHDSPDGSLRNEARVLESLAAELPLEFTSMLPQVSGYDESVEAEVLIESSVDGTPLWIAMQRSARPRSAFLEEMTAVGRWLAVFQRNTRRTESTAGVISQAAAEHPLRDLRVAPVAVHGDFWARNILVDRGRVTAVVDWEAAQREGAPWRDLFDFAVLFAANTPSWRHRSAIDSLRAALLGDGAAARSLRAFFAAWKRESAADASTLHSYLELYLTEALADAGKEATGWRATMPWSAIHAEIAGRDLFAFSG